MNAFDNIEIDYMAHCDISSCSSPVFHNNLQVLQFTGAPAATTSCSVAKISPTALGPLFSGEAGDSSGSATHYVIFEVTVDPKLIPKKVTVLLFLPN